MPNNQKHKLWDTLWTHARLATMSGEGYGIIDDGAIGIQAGKIVWVGAMGELPDTQKNLARDVRNARRQWMTPGLVDCHTHLVYAGNRSNEFAMRLQGKSYAQIAQAGGGILSTVRATRDALEEELILASARRLQSFLLEGVTTIEIKSGYGLDLDSEMKILRVARHLEKHYPVTIRTTFLGAHALPPEFYGNADDYIDYIRATMLPAIAKARLADAVDGFCENIGFSPAQIETLFDTATRLGLPVKLHAEQLSDQGGAALAAKYNALSADHLEYLSEEGVKAMAASGTVAVLLPGAFYMLNEKHKPPVALLRRHGVPIAIASDCNPGTSPACSLLLMLNMGCVLFGLTPEEALRGATQNAAKALGMAAAIGTLEVGKQADIALWDIEHPDELSYHIGYNPCRGVIKQGDYKALKG